MFLNVMLQSYWEKYEKMNLLKNDGLVFICKVVQRQLSYSQESSEASSLLISNALKVLCLYIFNVRVTHNRKYFI